MSVKIYRKSDLKIVSSVPDGVSPERDFELNVGGDISDYGFIDVPLLYFKLETINGVVQAIEIEPPPQPEPEPQPPSVNEVLMDYIVDVDYRVTMIELGM